MKYVIALWLMLLSSFAAFAQTPDPPKPKPPTLTFAEWQLLATILQTASAPVTRAEEIVQLKRDIEMVGRWQQMEEQRAAAKPALEPTKP